MKNFLTKIGYMALGSLLTLIGYHFGNIDNNRADAQVEFGVKEKSEIVDEIRCRKLVIVGEDDIPRINLATDGFDHGFIQIFNENGARRVLLNVTHSDTGSLEIHGKESGGMAAWLSVDDNGGYMALWNKAIDKAVLQAGITNKGKGFILTRDKAGYDTDATGVEGTAIFSDKSRN